MCEKESQRLATIIKLEKEITEIKKVVNQAYHRLNTLEQGCKEIRNQEGQEEAEPQQQQADGSERKEEARNNNLTQTWVVVVLSLTSHAHHAPLLNLLIREREKENKNQVFVNLEHNLYIKCLPARQGSVPYQI